MSMSSSDHSLLLRWVFALGVLASLVVSTVGAFHLGNQQMLFLLIGLLAVLVISGLLSAAICLFFLPKAPVSLSKPQAGNSPNEGGYLCPAWATLLAQAKIQWFTKKEALPVDISLQSGRESLRFGSRMLAKGIIREICITDWTGLFHWRLRGEIPGFVQVDPPLQKGKLTKDFYDGSDGDLESPAGKASGDVTDSRFYQSGDSVRRILWSVVAKEGGLARAGDRLMVRSEEKVTSRRVALFFLPGSQSDEAAAGFARACIEKDLLGGDWIFSTLEVKTPLKRDRRKALEAIDASGGGSISALDASVAQLKEFTAKIMRGGIGKLFVIVDASLLEVEEGLAGKITSSAPGATILAVCSNARRIPSYSKAIKCVEVDAA